jgi:hypothetical protein
MFTPIMNPSICRSKSAEAVDLVRRLHTPLGLPEMEAVLRTILMCAIGPSVGRPGGRGVDASWDGQGVTNRQQGTHESAWPAKGGGM